MKAFSMLVLTLALLAFAACNNAAMSESTVASSTEEDDRVAILQNRIELLEARVAEQDGAIAEHKAAMAGLKNLVQKTYAKVDQLSRAPKVQIRSGTGTGEGVAVPNNSIPFEFNGDTYYLTPALEQASTHPSLKITYEIDELSDKTPPSDETAGD